MFESNYNGTFEQYIDAFAKVLGTGMNMFWFTSFGFPGPLPVQPFKDYIRANEFVLDHYYSAYPTESATQVVTALELRARHIAFRNSAEGLEPATFAKNFDMLQAPPQPPDEKHKSKLRRAIEPILQLSHAVRELLRSEPGPGRRSRSKSGKTRYFTSLAPIRENAQGELADALAKLAGASPFAAIPEVHVGRWLIIDELKYGWPGAPSDKKQLASKYLLCTAVITADDDASAAGLLDRFLRALLQANDGAAASVWSHCVGFPGASDIDASVAYLKRGQLDTVLFYVGYDDATPADVQRAAAGRELLTTFARMNQGLDPTALKSAYLSEAATWDL
jgi:hypothetical protein